MSNPINAKLQEQYKQLQKLSYQYQGTLEFYMAACVEGDGTEADKLRLKLHAILDAQLDAHAVCLMLTRQLYGGE